MCTAFGVQLVATMREPGWPSVPAEGKSLLPGRHGALDEIPVARPSTLPSKLSKPPLRRTAGCCESAGHRDSWHVDMLLLCSTLSCSRPCRAQDDMSMSASMWTTWS
eukprot:4265224-Amphidinium_carterae.1